MQKKLVGKSVYMPLMATGAAGLSYENSAAIMIEVLQENKDFIIKRRIEITLAIPDDSNGYKLFEKLKEGHDKDNLEDLIKKSNQHFFLVGSNWDGADQAERFYMENIWETGYDEKYADVINSIKKDDILIHKSSFPNREGETFLRFKGWGKVKANQNNGTAVDVIWHEQGHKVDIKDLGYYRSTIMVPSNDDLEAIIKSLPPQMRERFINDLKGSDKIDESLHFAGLVSDSDTGADYLNIMPDVNSFALVLAAKTFEPPLAVALLGRWGSGKSFFMKKLRKQIEALSVRGTGYFCEGIVHVHFNAWSYMDANLWASITTNIFEELNRYIKKDTRASENTKEIEKKMIQDLSVAKEEISGLETQKKEIDTQLKQLSDKKSKAKNELDTRIKKLGSRSLIKSLEEVNKNFKATEKITKAVTDNPGVAQDIKDFKKIVPEKYWPDPEEMYKQASAFPSLIRLFTTDKNARTNWLWLAGTIIVIFAVCWGVEEIVKFFKLNLVWLNPSVWIFLTTAGSLYLRGVKAYKKYQPLLSSLWSIKEDYLKERDKVTRNFEQEEKALIQEIEYKKKTLESIDTQITNIKVVRSTVEFKISSALSTTALYEFIEKRCSSDDYKKHLGLVSVVRKDFEILSDLFTGHREEFAESGKSEEFRSLFEKPLERIVLYIDDLDRCPEDRVIEVLEAVNLLMAFPLFIVVVGVDPIWVRNALAVKYASQFKVLENGYKSMDASDYLEKIFQIAFHLKTAEESSIRNMLKNLSEVQQLPAAFVVEKEIAAADTDSGYSSEYEDSYSAEAVIENFEIPHETIVKALGFTKEERSFIEDMSIVLGSNPRLIKRFINIYRILKSHEYMRKDDIGSKDLESVLLLLAISISRFRTLMDTLLIYMDISHQNETLHNFLQLSVLEDQTGRLKKDLINLLTASKPELLKVKITDFKKHAAFVKRFAF